MWTNCICWEKWWTQLCPEAALGCCCYCCSCVLHACVCVCVVHGHVWVCICVCGACMCVWMYLCVCIDMFLCVCMDMCAQVTMGLHGWVCVCVCVCVCYMGLCVPCVYCVCVFMCVYVNLNRKKQPLRQLWRWETLTPRSTLESSPSFCLWNWCAVIFLPEVTTCKFRKRAGFSFLSQSLVLNHMY